MSEKNGIDGGRSYLPSSGVCTESQRALVKKQAQKIRSKNACGHGLVGPFPHALTDIVERALAEDAPHGDITTLLTVDLNATLHARICARESGVMAGGMVVVEVWRQIDPRVKVTLNFQEGEHFSSGAILAVIQGPSAAILTGERIALNLLQHMCAIATRTSTYVAISNAGALEAGVKVPRVVDTRKTTPGLREIEKYAVRVGGGHNHRFNLSEAVMVKDNHLVALTIGKNIQSITEAITIIRDQLPHTTHIEVEVDSLGQIEEVVSAGVDSIMLDNFTPQEIREGIAIIAGRALVEASGGITLETIGRIAATGVDIISVGALTNGVGSIDLGLDCDDD